MLSLVEVSRYRSLKYCQQPLLQSHLLLGPNASGKSTFMDVLAFLSDIMAPKSDLIQAIEKRTTTPEDLLWNKEGEECGFAVECKVPDGVTKENNLLLRYEIIIQLSPKPAIKQELLTFIHESNWNNEQPTLFFPNPDINIKDIHSPRVKRAQSIISRKPEKNTNYYPEGKKGFKPYIKTEDTISGISSIPNPEHFPVAMWFRNFFQKGILKLNLNSEEMRSPSPPTHPEKRLMPHGSNLPRVIENLRKKDSHKFDLWLEHIRTGLPDIQNIEIVEIESNKYKYLAVVYKSGLKVPSWLVSDGTLRVLALTLLAYCPLEDSDGIYLLEEPENGVHPKIMDLITDSLRSISDGQVLIASHSPVMLTLWQDKKEEILCFAKNEEGASDIVSGEHHPALKKYLSSTPDPGTGEQLSLQDLYCSGVLG